MDSELIHDRGRGAELIGTRTTVHNIFHNLLDPTATEAEIARMNGLTEVQVAALGAYILCHPEAVLAQHLKIEERLAIGNPPEVIEKAETAQETIMKYRDWYDRHQREEAEYQAKRASGEIPDPPDSFPMFREWIMNEKSRATCGT